MRRLTLWMVGFVLALPGPAFGQAVKRADFVGTWVRLGYPFQGQHRGDFWRFNPDGTYLLEPKLRTNDGEWKIERRTREGSWSLTGDTLVTDTMSYRILVRDRRLILFDVRYTRINEVCADPGQFWERFDSLTSMTFKSHVPTMTMRPEDVVGTWAGSQPDWRGGFRTDTLFMGADYTVRSVTVGPPDDAHERGTWSLHPDGVLIGEPLKGAYQPPFVFGNTKRKQVFLRNGNTEMVPCMGDYAPLKRVAP